MLIHTIKEFGIVKETEVDFFFLEFPSFLYDPVNVAIYLWFLFLF